MKALALGQLPALFGCYLSRCSTYPKPPGAEYSIAGMYMSQSEYKIGSFQIIPRDPLMEFLLPILTWFFQIRFPDYWDGVGRDTSTKLFKDPNLWLPSSLFVFLMLMEQQAEKSVGGDNYPEKPGSGTQWRQRIQEIHCGKFMTSDNGKWIIIAFKT